MAGSNRRFTLAAITLPFLLVVMSGLARANTIFVNSLRAAVTGRYARCPMRSQLPTAGSRLADVSFSRERAPTR